MSIATFAVGTVAILSGMGSSVGFHLHAYVPTMCSISSIAPVEGLDNQIDVLASCNSDRFRIALGGDLADRPIALVESSTAQTAIMAGGVEALPSRPGLHQFRITFAGNLAGVQSANAQIEAD
jgi:hypothetical protein